MKVCSKCKVEKPKAEFSKNASKKDGFHSECKACNAEYYKTNRTAIAAVAAANRAVNRTAISVRHSEYYKANRSAIAAKMAEYYKANRVALIAYSCARAAANPKKHAAYGAAWAKANPAKVAARTRNRRARKRNADGRHSAADVRAIFEAQRGLCANCQSKLFKSGKNKFHVDHIMPLALGGSNWPANLQCLCPACNLSKGAKHPDDWAKENGRLI